MGESRKGVSKRELVWRVVLSEFLLPLFLFLMKRLFLLVLGVVMLLGTGCTSGSAESSSAESNGSVSSSNAQSSNAQSSDTPSDEAAASENTAMADLPEVTVYKSAACNCCAKWVDHMKQSGFSVKTLDMPNVRSIKDKLGVPRQLRSCHTAYVGGEVVEGHVPASVVKQYLKADSARAQGLAVPGMPVGSPGMEVEGRPAQPYQVIAFRGDGRVSIYSRQNGSTNR